MDVTSPVPSAVTSPRPRRGGRSEPLLRHVIGGILRRARLAQGRTLVDVAASARVSTAYLSEVERGRKEASSEVLAAVCGALSAPRHPAPAGEPVRDLPVARLPLAARPTARATDVLLLAA